MRPSAPSSAPPSAPPSSAPPSAPPSCTPGVPSAPPSAGPSAPGRHLDRLRRRHRRPARPACPRRRRPQVLRGLTHVGLLTSRGTAPVSAALNVLHLGPTPQLCPIDRVQGPHDPRPVDRLRRRHRRGPRDRRQWWPRCGDRAHAGVPRLRRRGDLPGQREGGRIRGRGGSRRRRAVLRACTRRDVARRLRVGGGGRRRRLRRAAHAGARGRTARPDGAPVEGRHPRTSPSSSPRTLPASSTSRSRLCRCCGRPRGRSSR